MYRVLSAPPEHHAMRYIQQRIKAADKDRINFSLRGYEDISKNPMEKHR